MNGHIDDQVIRRSIRSVSHSMHRMNGTMAAVTLRLAEQLARVVLLRGTSMFELDEDVRNTLSAFLWEHCGGVKETGGQPPVSEDDHPEPDSMAIQEGAMDYQDDEITAPDAFRYPTDSGGGDS